MNRFVKVELQDGSGAVTLNRDLVAAIEDDVDGSIIYLPNGECIAVKATPEQIISSEGVEDLLKGVNE